MPGADLTPVTVGAIVLAVLTYFVYRGVQRTRPLRQAGRPVPRSFSVTIAAYVVAWIGFALIVVAALRGGI